MRSTECPAAAQRGSSPSRAITSSSWPPTRVSTGAVARFGPPQRIAVEVARAVQPVVLFRSTLVFLGALALFVLPLYAIPENTLPPAPWDERPEYLTWKLYVSLGAFGVAVPAALIAVAAAWRRRRRTRARQSQPRRHGPRRERGGRRDRGRPVGPGRARKRHDARLDPGRDRVSRGRRRRVASIGRACPSLHPRPTWLISTPRSGKPSSTPKGPSSSSPARAPARRVCSRIASRT